MISVGLEQITSFRFELIKLFTNGEAWKYGLSKKNCSTYVGNVRTAMLSELGRKWKPNVKHFKLQILMEKQLTFFQKISNWKLYLSSSESVNIPWTNFELDIAFEFNCNCKCFSEKILNWKLYLNSSEKCKYSLDKSGIGNITSKNWIEHTFEQNSKRT